MPPYAFGQSVRRVIRWPARIGLALMVLLAGPLTTMAFGPVNAAGDWSLATHRASGQAPPPATTPEAVVQVYGARAFGWRGAFAMHTWLAAKPAGADRYTRYEVIGWRAYRGLPTIAVGTARAPDAEWFGAQPVLLRDLRGPAAEAVLARLGDAIARYPFPTTYRAWPGPNSNTFTAHLGREIPELGLALPALALGKDYLPGFAATSPGGGWQISAWGAGGLLWSPRQGLEINVLGLVFGIDPRAPALSLPGIGRLEAP